jgi:hypothetical protein
MQKKEGSRALAFAAPLARRGDSGTIGLERLDAQRAEAVSAGRRKTNQWERGKRKNESVGPLRERKKKNLCESTSALSCRLSLFEERKASRLSPLPRVARQMRETQRDKIISFYFFFTLRLAASASLKTPLSLISLSLFLSLSLLSSFSLRILR